MARSLLLDSNLAVLYAVGATNIKYIAKHKRLQTYDVTDYTIICNIMASFDDVVFTPNVLTETSNLLGQIGDPIRTEIARTFSDIVRRAEERFVDSKVAVNHSHFVRLDLTDAVLLLLAASGATLLTVDLDLYLATQSSGLNGVNYNHVRDQRRADFAPT